MWSGDRGFGFLRRDDGQEEPMKPGDQRRIGAQARHRADAQASSKEVRNVGLLTVIPRGRFLVGEAPASSSIQVAIGFRAGFP